MKNITSTQLIGMMPGIDSENSEIESEKAMHTGHAGVPDLSPCVHVCAEATDLPISIDPQYMNMSENIASGPGNAMNAEHVCGDPTVMHWIPEMMIGMPENILTKPANIIIEPENVTIKLANITIEPENIVVKVNALRAGKTTR
jgi:hypothetical protein